MADHELPVDGVSPPDIARALSPLWVIDNRLAYHAHPDHTDRLLSGLRFDREGKIDLVGARDLPYVSVNGYEDSEGYGARDAGPEESPVEYSARLTLLIGAKRDYGLMMRDPRATITDNRYEGIGAAEWVQRVKDAIETTAENSPRMDWTLDGTVLRPCLFTTDSADISNLVWLIRLDVQIWIEQINRAHRSVESGFIFDTVNRNPIA